MIHDSENSSAIRVSIASASPTNRAFFCCSAGSLPASMEMKTMLSMPRTSSSAVSVANAIHTCGSANQSIYASPNCLLLSLPAFELFVPKGHQRIDFYRAQGRNANSENADEG